MRRSFLFLALSAVAVVGAAAETVVELKRADDLAAWELVATPAADLVSVVQLAPDGTAQIAGKPVGYLATKASFSRYTLHVEWRWPEGAPRTSNSGILLNIASGPKDRAWPLCFQVQTKLGRGGDLLPMAGASFAEPLSTPPDAKTPQLNRAHDDAEQPVGQWNTCDVTCRDGAIEVTVNGVKQVSVTAAKPAAGTIGFQLEGAPYELRHVRIVGER